MDNSCEKFIPMISAYIDGELSSLDEKKLAQHLDTCLSCQRLLRDYQAIHSARFLSEPPPGLHEDIMSRIKAEPKPRRKKIVPFRYATAAAAVVALVLLGASGAFGSLFSSLTPTEVSVQSASTAMDTALAESAAEVRAIPAEIDVYDSTEILEETTEEEAAVEYTLEGAEDAEEVEIIIADTESDWEEATEETVVEDSTQLMTFTALVTSMENGSYGCIISYDGGDTEKYLPQELFVEQNLLGTEPLSLGDRITVTVAITGTDDDPGIEVIDVVVDHEE